MINGVIFDMDGTLLDTERVLIRCWIKSAALHGFEMKEQYALNIRSLQYRFAEPYLKRVFGESFDYMAIRETRKQLFAEELQKNGIPVKQGVLPFLQFCKEQQIPTVVATATPKDRATRYLEEVEFLPYFTEIFGSNQVKTGKPFPDIYQAAAQSIGCAPSDCMAFEDAPNGVLSAFYAGCKVVMIPDLSQPDEMLQPFLYATAPNLEQAIPILKEAIQNG